MTDDESGTLGTRSRPESDDEEISEEEIVEVRKPTLSDILLSAEEKRARQEYRLAASKCCVEEAWRMYRRVTNSENAIEPANLDKEPGSVNETLITRMGVLFDPTAGMRMRFLKNKFAHLLSGFRSIKQAAYKPFIRCQKPQKMDIDGRGKSMPVVAKAYHREVYVTYSHPSTFSYKEKWTKIFNSNFVTKEDMLKDMEDSEAQTTPFEVYSTKKLRFDDAPRDLSVEKFDIEDIPLDSDGNPIGRSVGICEWCGKSILPIPSSHTLSVEWNTEALYCCDKYRMFIEETTRATNLIETEYEEVRQLIDVKPRTSKLSDSKKKQLEAMGILTEGAASPSSGKQPGKGYLQGAAIKSQLKQQRQFDFAKFSTSYIEKYKGEMEPPPYSDIGVDTYDLPWDPAETRMAQAQRMYEEKTNPDKLLLTGGGHPNTKTTLKDISILLGLEEVYSHDSPTNSLRGKAETPVPPMSPTPE